MLLQPLAAYGQFLYLDRGYAFFAPDPGPSHLLRVELREKDSNFAGPDSRGTEIEVRTYPSLGEQWPRLLYHRHFMLAEFLNDAYQPALPAEAAGLVGPELPVEELRQWRRGRQRYELVLGSLKNHLQSKFPDREIQIDRLEHLLPDFVAYAENPTPLNDPPTYVVMQDIPISLETLLGSDLQGLPDPGLREGIPSPSGERVEVTPMAPLHRPIERQEQSEAASREAP